MCKWLVAVEPAAAAAAAAAVVASAVASAAAAAAAAAAVVAGASSDFVLVAVWLFVTVFAVFAVLGLRVIRGVHNVGSSFGLWGPCDCHSDYLPKLPLALRRSLRTAAADLLGSHPY